MRLGNGDHLGKRDFVECRGFLWEGRKWKMHPLLIHRGNGLLELSLPMITDISSVNKHREGNKGKGDV